MKLEKIETIYRDGAHNAFTDIVRWKGKYWVCFRNGDYHHSLNSRIFVISSPDLEAWSAPAVPIDTEDDNRDPKMFVLNDKLYVTCMTIRQSVRPSDGKRLNEDFFTLASYTEDGVRWSEPRRVWEEPFKCIWWAETVGHRVFGSGYDYKPVDEAGRLSRGSDRSKKSIADFIATEDGLDWRGVSVISQERQPSEVALACLPDERIVAFVRHDDDEAPFPTRMFPEIKVASPPYTAWESVMDIPFWTNGPCLGVVDGTLVAASRAMLDWSPPEEVARLAEPGAIRGLLLMTIDIDERKFTPQLVIPCAPHAEGTWPDVSYAGIVDLGGGTFALSYYDGLKEGPSDIKLARLRLS